MFFYISLNFTLHHAKIWQCLGKGTKYEPFACQMAIWTICLDCRSTDCAARDCYTSGKKNIYVKKTPRRRYFAWNYIGTKKCNRKYIM